MSPSPEQQAALIPALLPTLCAPSYPHTLTSLASDWNDIDAVVDYIRSLRHVQRMDLIAWSRGGPRFGGYAAQNPDKVGKLVLLAPVYNLNRQPERFAISMQSYQDFRTNWDSQVACTDQYDPAARDRVWSEMMKSDPVGSTWASGVRLAPGESMEASNWNSAVAAKVHVPTLMISGQQDKIVPPARVQELYADLGSKQKVFIDVACSSHNAMWERNHLLLFDASLEWLTSGSVDGKEEGVLKLGYKKE